MPASRYSALWHRLAQIGLTSVKACGVVSARCRHRECRHCWPARKYRHYSGTLTALSVQCQESHNARSTRNYCNRTAEHRTPHCMPLCPGTLLSLSVHTRLETVIILPRHQSGFCMNSTWVPGEGRRRRIAREGCRIFLFNVLKKICTAYVSPAS